MIILYLYIILKTMQEKMNIEIDKELYDDIQMLKQVIPQETDWEMNDNEILKLVVWTFMAFAVGEEWKENEDEHEYNHEWWCGCGTWCGCH